MLDQRTSVREFLETRHLVTERCGFSAAERRTRLESSGLLRLMDSVCATINREAGRMVVDAHFYLAPQPLVNSFTFFRNDTEYVMQLEVHGANPVLVFVARKWRDSSGNSLMRLLIRLILPAVREAVVHICWVDESCVSEEEVKSWFFYLLSGFSRRFLPHPPAESIPAVAELGHALRTGDTCS